MTVRVRVRQVSADSRKFNVEMCRDIDTVAVHCRWPLTTGVAKAGTFVQLVIINDIFVLSWK